MACAVAAVAVCVAWAAPNAWVMVAALAGGFWGCSLLLRRCVHAVLEPVEHAGGLTVALEADGTVAPDRLAAVLDSASEPVSVVSIIAVNNETGCYQDCWI